MNRVQSVLLFWILILLAIVSFGYNRPPLKRCGADAHWNKLPIVLSLDSSVDTFHAEALQTAIDHMETQTGLDLFTVNSTRLNLEFNRDSYNAIGLVSDWETDRRFEQARTTLYWNGFREALEADIRLNTRDFQYFTGSEIVAYKVHLESLYMHELGHALGLMHRDEDSIMVKSLPSGHIRTKLTESDRNAIKCLYDSNR